MSYRSLREFAAKLESERELVRVREPVSTVLEMTEIQTRLLAERGPAVIFENALRADGARSDIPVLVNLFGTVKRDAMGVTLGGVERRDAKSLRDVGELLATLRQPEPPRSIGEAFEMLPLAKTFMAMKPKTVGQSSAEIRATLCDDQATYGSAEGVIWSTAIRTSAPTRGARRSAQPRSR